MQGDGCRQAGAEPGQRMGARLGQAKAMQEAVMHAFDDLAQARVYPPQRFGPGLRRGLVAFGRAEHLCARGGAPMRQPAFALKAGSGYYVAAKRVSAKRWSALEAGAQP